jgi:FecR-like protein
MKNRIGVSFLISLVTLAVFSFYCQAQASGGDNDSLLFDGSDNEFSTPKNADCEINVRYVIPSVEGTRYITKTYQVCGGFDTSRVGEKGIVVKGDELVPGEEIVTGPDGNIVIELEDGSVIKLGPNSKAVVARDWCTSDSKVEKFFGKMWSKVKKALGASKYEVQTTRGAIGHRGTEFSVESENEQEIVRVFEGSVYVMPRDISGQLKEITSEIEKLSDDFKAGKVSAEENQKKSVELLDRMTKKVESVTNPQVVEAGYKCTITNDISLPELIEPGYVRWFEDPRFHGE